MTDQDGRPLRGRHPADAAPRSNTRERLPASYANFYIANGVVLLPTYDPRRDAEATRYAAAPVSRPRVVGIDCTDLVWGLGAFHCVTQQWPAL